MIGIKIIPVAEYAQHREEFFKSLHTHAHDRDSYVCIYPEDKLGKDIEVVISLPDNCLVLHHSWDKYVRHMLDSEKQMDSEFVKKRFGLVDRRHTGIYPEIEIEYNLPQRRYLFMVPLYEKLKRGIQGLAGTHGFYKPGSGKGASPRDNHGE